jgi:hypothetical protein
MNSHTKLQRLVNMSSEHWDVPMRVELRPFLEFNRRMACQMRELVERWEGHTPKEQPRPMDKRRRSKH